MANNSELGEIPPGADIRDLRPWLNQLRAIVLEGVLGRSPDIIADKSSGQTILKIRRTEAASSRPLWPFEIQDASTSTVAKVIVRNGYLGSGIPAANNSVPITSLETELDVGSDYIIYLRWTESGGGSWQIYAEDVATLTNWPVYPLGVDDDGATPPAQTDYWLMLGYVGSVPTTPSEIAGFEIILDPAGTPTPAFVYQCVMTNLFEQDICVNGVPCIYPFPWFAPRP